MKNEWAGSKIPGIAIVKPKGVMGARRQVENGDRETDKDRDKQTHTGDQVDTGGVDGGEGEEHGLEERDTHMEGKKRGDKRMRGKSVERDENEERTGRGKQTQRIEGTVGREERGDSNTGCRDGGTKEKESESKGGSEEIRDVRQRQESTALGENPAKKRKKVHNELLKQTKGHRESPTPDSFTQIQWEGQDRDGDRRDRWRGIRLRRWPLIQDKIPEKEGTGRERSAPAEGEREHRKLGKTKPGDNRQDKRQRDKPEHRTRERDRNWRDKDGGGTVRQTTQKQERQVERNQLKKVSSRRDTERDIKNRQMERWRQKVRRQEQRDERRAERGGEETKIGDRQGEGRGKGEGEDTKTGPRRSARERKARVKWCIWCGIGCRGGEGERCKDRRQRKERRKQRLGDKGSGDTGDGTSAQWNSPGEGGKQVEKVRYSISSPQTQAGIQGDRGSHFKEGGKVERDVNRGKEGGIGLEAQDKKEEEREGTC